MGDSSFFSRRCHFPVDPPHHEEVRLHAIERFRVCERGVSRRQCCGVNVYGTTSSLLILPLYSFFQFYPNANTAAIENTLSQRVVVSSGGGSTGLREGP